MYHPKSFGPPTGLPQALFKYILLPLFVVFVVWAVHSVDKQSEICDEACIQLGYDRGVYVPSSPSTPMDGECFCTGLARPDGTLDNSVRVQIDRNNLSSGS